MALHGTVPPFLGPEISIDIIVRLMQRISLPETVLININSHKAFAAQILKSPGCVRSSYGCVRELDKWNVPLVM